MGDTICSGIFYLCSCCYFCSSSDPGSDGSGLCSSSRRDKKNRDPREKALKQEFMERVYRRDVSGRIHVEQPSKSQMMAAVHQPSTESELPKQPSITVEPTKDYGELTRMKPSAPPEIGDPP